MNLTDSNNSRAEEYPGSSGNKVKIEFDRVIPTHGQYLLDKFCQKAEEYPNDAIVGFKWKPYHLDHIAFLEGMQVLARHNVKVIRSRRNPLDRILSEIKHSKEPTELGTRSFLGQRHKVPAHCELQSNKAEKCLRAHAMAGTGMTVHPEAMLKELEQIIRDEDQTDQMLNDFGVPHVSVSYEELYYGEDASAWNRIFAFLQVGSSDWTREEVNSAMNHMDTSNQPHTVSIGNYEEVKQALEGTPYLELLTGS